MERILMQVCVVSVGVFGLLAVFCAAVWFWTKARCWSVLALPRVRLIVLAGGAIVATFAAQKGGIPDQPDDPPDNPSPNLVFWSTLDSVGAITNPKAGQSGTCSDATFSEGKSGTALCIPSHSDKVSFPLPDGLPTSRGCIEFWARLEGGNTTYYAGGAWPVLCRVDSAASGSWFFEMAFVANDGGGRGGLCTGAGTLRILPEVYGMKSYSSYLGEDVSGWHHYAYVWNVDGIASLSGNPRAACFVDGQKVSETDGGADFNSDEFKALMGQAASLHFGNASQSNIPFSIDEVKIWNVDKTTFAETPTHLVLHCTFDSAAAVTTPAAGDGGICSEATFVKGKKGSALRVPADIASAVARLPLPGGLPAASGCIEFWAKIDGGSTTYSGGGGCPDFLLARTADNDSTFISLAFTANDGAGRGGLGCGYGFYGLDMFSEGAAFAKSYSNYLTQDAVFDWHHYALVWNVDGITSLSGSPRAAIILDGTMRVSTNGNDDWNRDDFLAAMAKSVYLSFGHAGNHVTYLIDELKVWDADKTTFEATAELVYWSTLDSATAVTQPLVGSAGTCTGVTFKIGKNGSALHVPLNSDVATINLPEGLPERRGCIEFWARQEGDSETYRDCSNPSLFSIWREDSVGIGSMQFNANDGVGHGGLCCHLSEFYVTTDGYSYTKRYLDILKDDVFGWHHYALAWNVDGIAVLDGNPRMAVFVDGRMVGSTDGANFDASSFKANLKQQLHVKFGSLDNTSRVPYSIDEFKIWNADKTTFEDDTPAFVYYQDVAAVYDGQVHALLPPEGLSGNETFRYALDQNGPFTDEMPSLTDAGTLRIWYEETVDGMTIVSSAMITVEKRPLTFTSASATKPYDGTPLTASRVTAAGLLPMGEGFSFVVTGAQTTIGESLNVFTWTPKEGTKAGNYNVTAVFGTLKVVLDEGTGDIGYELVADGSGGQAIRITRLSYPEGGDVTLPVSLGGIPVSEVASGALAGTSVTGVRVPAGVTVAGTLFENLPQLTNATLEAGSAVSGVLSFSGSAALREVIVSADVTALAPHAFLGCWDLARVVFAGEPPFGNAVAGATGEVALLTASVRPATLLQMADMICYPVDCATRWEKALRNFGYGGRYGAYAPPWTGEASLVADSGNLNPASVAPVAVTNTLVVTNMVIVTNMMYSVVTNVLVPAAPDAQPGANYGAQAGVASGMTLAGTAGWDMFGVPDGMTWDRVTGTLGGVPTRSGIYDVMLVSGSGAETKLMRTTINVAGYAVTTGYVGVAFSASGAPWDNLSSYKNLPAGLKWAGKALSGVPTKAGAYSYETTAGEPIELTILALPDGAVGNYNGEMADGDGVRYPLTVSTTAAGKITAKVIKGTKTLSLSATKWDAMSVEEVNGAPHHIFRATLTANGLSLSVRVDADAAWNVDALTAEGTLGALENHSGSAQRNAYASDDAAKAAITALARSYALMVESDGSAGWTLVPAEPGVKGQCDVVLKTTGVATLSGKLPNKTSVNTTATLRIDEKGAASLRFYVKGTWIVWENLE